MVIFSIVQVDDKHLYLGMHLHYPLEQGDHTPCCEILLDVSPVQVFVVIGTIGPQDVQTFAATAHGNLQALPTEQPAIEQRLLTPHRMNSIDEVTTQGWADS